MGWNSEGPKLLTHLWFEGVAARRQSDKNPNKALSWNCIGIILTDTEKKWAELVHSQIKAATWVPRGQMPSSSLTDANNPRHLYLIAGATLIEAAYMAHKDAPDSANVKLTIKNGVKVSLLEPRTPPDVVHYYVDELNQRNKISSQTNIIQLYNLCPSIEAHWKRARKEKRKNNDREETGPEPTASNAQASTGKAGAARTQVGLEKEYKDFLDRNYPKRFRTFDSFKAARTFKTELTRLNVWDRYESWANKNVKWMDPTISNSNVCHVNSLVLKAFQQQNEELSSEDCDDLLLVPGYG